MISHTDSFVIQHGDEPYLTKKAIKRERKPYNYHNELSNHDILKFDSLESAITYLEKQTQVDNLCVAFIQHTYTGDFILCAKAMSVVDSRCIISAYLNLITGETNKSVTWI
jgi:hypothetical protein